MKKIVSVLSAIGLAVSLAACSPNPADNAPGRNTTGTSSYRPTAPDANRTAGYRADGPRTNAYTPGATAYGVGPRYTTDPAAYRPYGPGPRFGIGPSGTGTGTYDYGTPPGYGAGTNRDARSSAYGLGSGYGYGTGAVGTGPRTGPGITGYGAGTAPGYGTGRDGYGPRPNAYDPAARGTYRANPNGVVDDRTGRPGIFSTGVRPDARSSLLGGVGLRGRSDNGTYTSGDGRANDARYSAINRYSIYKADGDGARAAGNDRGRAQVGFVEIKTNQNNAGKTSASRGTGGQSRTASQGGSAANNGSSSNRAQSNQNTAGQNVYVDRQMLASAIAHTVKHVPGVKAATVLTTDNQIFVGCDTTGANSPARAKEILKKVHMSALNVSPRYYKVYTSNDFNKINYVQKNAASCGNMTDAQFEQTLGMNNRGSSTYSTTGANNKISSSQSRTHRNTKMNQSGTGGR